MSAPKPDSTGPETRERFLEWLHERDPDLARAAPGALERLDGLGGLDREGASFARSLTDSGAGDEESELLLQVHAAWTRFRRDERGAESPVAWVGAERPDEPESAVEWIEQEDLPARPPSGAAPSLLAPGHRPRRVKPPQRTLLRPTDLLVPLALVVSVVAVFVPAVLERRAVSALRQRAVGLLQEELSHWARPERLQRQADFGTWLARARETQREAVQRTCEGGDWCRARLATLSRSRDLARELSADARARGAAEPELDWRPAEATRRALLASLDRVAREASASAESALRAAHHREVVAEERSALAAAGIAP